MIADWITLSQTAGTSGVTTVTVTASSYSELLERSTSFNVVAGDKNAVVTVNQKADENFNLSPTSFDVGSAMTYCYIIVNSDLPWAVTSAPDWCSFSPVSASSGQQIAMVVTANTSTTTRSGSVVFTQSGTNVQRTVTVQQASVETHPVTITPANFTLPSSGGNRTIVIDTVDPWTLTIPSWATASQLSGTGSTDVVISASSNTGSDRYDVITVTTTSTTATASVAQSGGYVVPTVVVPTQDYDDYPTSGGVETITVSASTNWIAEVDVNWIRIRPMSGGSGDSTFYITTEENTSVSARTGHIYFYQYGTSNLLNTITISQEAAPVTFTISEQSLSFEPTGETKTITVYSNVPWTLENITEHYTASPVSGSGTTTVTITAPANTEYWNEDVLTFHYADTTAVVHLNQYPVPRFIITPSTLIGGGPAASYTITIDANVPFVAYTPDWITMDPSADASYHKTQHLITSTVSFASNNRCPYERQGDIVFSNANDEILFVYTVKQAAGIRVTDSTPYTVQMLTDGEILIDAGVHVDSATGQLVYDHHIEYTVDGDIWSPSDPYGESFEVKKGDIISFRSPYDADWTPKAEVHDGEYNAYGNLMSLSYQDYAGQTTSYTNLAYYWRRSATASESQRGTELVRCEYLIFPVTLVNEGGTLEHAFDGCNKLVAGPSSIRTEPTSPSIFDSMFRNCVSLVDAPALPYSGAIPSYAYIRMFEGCSSLVDAPALPSTEVGRGAYAYMFRYCSSLKNAPELPATTVGQDAYASMFKDCTSLETAPNINGVGTSFAQHMFEGCTSLVNAPVLPDTVTTWCYRYMFAGCTSLVKAPALNAKTLSTACYQGMFSGCSSLNYIRCLAESAAPDSTLSWTDGVALYGTFVDSEDAPSGFWTRGINGIPVNWSITHYVPDVVDVEPASYTFDSVSGSSVFTVRSRNGWTAVSDSPWITVSPASGTSSTTSVTITVSANSGTGRGGHVTFSSEFDTVVDISQRGNPVADISTPLTFNFFEDGQLIVRALRNAAELAYRYEGETAWRSISLSGGSNTLIPVNETTGRIVEMKTLSDNNTGSADINITSTSMHEVYGNVHSILFADESAWPATTLNVYVGGLFQNDTGLADASALILPATTLGITGVYANMFRDCTSLVKGPELNFTVINGTDACSDMFNGCTSLLYAPAQLKPTSLTAGCYYGMFEGCSGITTAPILPASTLRNNCYGMMFYGCTNLNRVTCLATTGMGGSRTANWLSGVAQSGVFTQADGATWDSGTSGIPDGWTIENA